MRLIEYVECRIGLHEWRDVAVEPGSKHDLPDCPNSVEVLPSYKEVRYWWSDGRRGFVDIWFKECARGCGKRVRESRERPDPTWDTPRVSR